MRCPKCKKKTDVVDSRPAAGNQVRRRRKCPKCSHKFTTYEVRATVAPLVAKVPPKPKQPTTRKPYIEKPRIKPSRHSPIDPDRMTDAELEEWIMSGNDID